ncbi:MAG: hypothetical protein KDA92_26485, partial [Planctomycetales bacterium]|nr:hypothetical protein [Planctomycetales bacterium]
IGFAILLALDVAWSTAIALPLCVVGVVSCCLATFALRIRSWLVVLLPVIILLMSLPTDTALITGARLLQGEWLSITVAGIVIAVGGIGVAFFVAPRLHRWRSETHRLPITPGTEWAAWQGTCDTGATGYTAQGWRRWLYDAKRELPPQIKSLRTPEDRRQLLDWANKPDMSSWKIMLCAGMGGLVGLIGYRLAGSSSRMDMSAMTFQAMMFFSIGIMRIQQQWLVRQPSFSWESTLPISREEYTNDIEQLVRREARRTSLTVTVAMLLFATILTLPTWQELAIWVVAILVLNTGALIYQTSICLGLLTLPRSWRVGALAVVGLMILVGLCVVPITIAARPQQAAAVNWHAGAAAAGIGAMLYALGRFLQSLLSKRWNKLEFATLDVRH